MDTICFVQTNRMEEMVSPAPQIKILWPKLTPALLHVWTPTESGSSKAPSSVLTWSGNLITGNKLVLKAYNQQHAI